MHLEPQKCVDDELAPHLRGFFRDGCLAHACDAQGSAKLLGQRFGQAGTRRPHHQQIFEKGKHGENGLVPVSDHCHEPGGDEVVDGRAYRNHGRRVVRLNDDVGPHNGCVQGDAVKASAQSIHALFTSVQRRREKEGKKLVMMVQKLPKEHDHGFFTNRREEDQLPHQGKIVGQCLHIRCDVGHIHHPNGTCFLPLNKTVDRTDQCPVVQPGGRTGLLLLHGGHHREQRAMLHALDRSTFLST